MSRPLFLRCQPALRSLLASSSSTSPTGTLMIRRSANFSSSASPVTAVRATTTSSTSTTGSRRSYHISSSRVAAASSSSESSPLEPNLVLEGFPDDVGKRIARATLQQQTSVSLQDLMRTGQGEYLHKSFGGEDSENFLLLNKEHNNHQTTELVLIQVAGFLRREMPVRLAHRIRDLERIPLMKDIESIRAIQK